jgi:hypothetical protein
LGKSLRIQRDYAIRMHAIRSVLVREVCDQ